jgi:co-chaperonin GroES (HSP10)
MKAVGKYIVIIPEKEVESKTKGGLLLAEEHREDIRYRKAEVVTIGDTVIAVKNKDKIYYDRHAGFGVEINKEQYKVIKEQDVVIIL